MCCSGCLCWWVCGGVAVGGDLLAHAHTPSPRTITSTHLRLHPRPFSVSGYVLVGVEVGGCTAVLVFGDPEDVVLVCRQYTCSLRTRV